MIRRLQHAISAAARALRGFRLEGRLAEGVASEASPSWRLPFNEALAINVSTVWACVRAISDPIGFLPLHVYRRLRAGGRERAYDHPVYRLLHDAPSENISACHWRSTQQAHVLLRGNAFARIRRASGSRRVVSLDIIHPSAVTMKEQDGGWVYLVQRERGGVEEIQPRDMLHVRGLSPDGRWGYSVVSLARESITLAVAMERYGSSFFASGGRVPYVLEHPGGFRTQEEYEEFRRRWREAYGTPDSWHQAVVITGGMKYTPIGISPEDAQFLASRQFQVQEICRWFRVSPHLVADLSRATFSNIEHLGIEFLTQTLSYWLKVWEQELALKLLDEEHYCEFDANALVRGEFEARMRGYATQLQNGILSVNEVRALENLNPIEGGDVHHIQLNMQPLGGGNAGSTGASYSD